MRIGPQLYHIRCAGKRGHNRHFPVMHRAAQYGPRGRMAHQIRAKEMTGQEDWSWCGRGASFGGIQSNSPKARTSFGCVNPLVNALDPALRPSDKRNVIRLTDFFTHVAHHAQVRIRAHPELVTHLSVGESARQSAQHDCFFAGQDWVQPESENVLDADYFGFVFHGVT
jgi:hypothetical protein